jgi:hypothetical protein
MSALTPRNAALATTSESIFTNSSGLPVTGTPSPFANGSSSEAQGAPVSNKNKYGPLPLRITRKAVHRKFHPAVRDFHALNHERVSRPRR